MCITGCVLTLLITHCKSSFNTLEWESRFNLGLNTTEKVIILKNTLKLFGIKFPIKNSVDVHLSLSPPRELQTKVLQNYIHKKLIGPTSLFLPGVELDGFKDLPFFKSGNTKQIHLWAEC